jgi:NAD(P)-dependent dehydrogenase (short-subunit alcohol dehydrogenase family)
MPGIRDFKDRVVVITGAGSGIGRATAIAFAAEKADLVIADINEKSLADAAKDISALGARVLTRVVDVSDREAMAAFASAVISERGRVDILHNNAGFAIGARIESLTLDDWDRILKVNLWGVIHGINFFLPHMIKRRQGHIVNTSSVLGLCAAPGTGAYNTTKFAVAGLGETLRAELRRYNIGVTTLCPGVINTAIITNARLRLPEATVVDRDNLEDFYRSRGWPPERVARAVLKAVRCNRSVVPVGPEVWAQWFFKRLSQSAYDAAIAFADRKLL